MFAHPISVHESSDHHRCIKGLDTLGAFRVESVVAVLFVYCSGGLVDECFGPWQVLPRRARRRRRTRLQVTYKVTRREERTGQARWTR
jgi:hypothetical protein